MLRSLPFIVVAPPFLRDCFLRHLYQNIAHPPPHSHLHFLRNYVVYSTYIYRKMPTKSIKTNRNGHMTRLLYSRREKSNLSSTNKAKTIFIFCSTICKITCGQRCLWRRARGAFPSPLFLLLVLWVLEAVGVVVAAAALFQGETSFQFLVPPSICTEIFY